MWRDMIINKVIQSEMKVTSITTDKIKIARSIRTHLMS